MTHRGLDVSLGLEPGRRARVELDNRLRVRARELTPQDVGEEPVESIPLPASVDGYQKQVRTFDLGEP
jgi:hypothetical protein